jgi:hypothetical protein
MRNHARLPKAHVESGTLNSDRGLEQVLSEDPHATPSLLIHFDEMRATMQKMAIKNSSLA